MHLLNCFQQQWLKQCLPARRQPNGCSPESDSSGSPAGETEGLSDLLQCQASLWPSLKIAQPLLAPLASHGQSAQPLATLSDPSQPASPALPCLPRLPWPPPTRGSESPRPTPPHQLMEQVSKTTSMRMKTRMAGEPQAHALYSMNICNSWYAKICSHGLEMCHVVNTQRTSIKCNVCWNM